MKKIIHKKIPARRTVILDAVKRDLELSMPYITLDTPTPEGMYKVKVTQNDNLYIETLSLYAKKNGELLREIDYYDKDSEAEFVDQWFSDWIFIPRFPIYECIMSYDICLNLVRDMTIMPCLPGVYDFIRNLDITQQGKSFNLFYKYLKNGELWKRVSENPILKNKKIYIYKIQEEELEELGVYFSYNIIDTSYIPKYVYV